MNSKHEFSIMTVLIPVLMVGLLMACSPTTRSTAADVAKTAGMIAEFDLPEGYQSEFAIHLLEYSLAGYNPGDGHSHLYIVQSENETDGEKLAETLAEYTAGDQDKKARLKVVETRELTVRGQSAVMVVSDGVNSDDQPYRQATVAFRGKGGPALLVISEPSDRWNQENIDAFLASIH